MKLPFLKRRHPADKALAALGHMPKVRIGNPFALRSLEEYDEYPPAPCCPAEMREALGSFNLNRALRRRILSNFLHYK